MSCPILTPEQGSVLGQASKATTQWDKKPWWGSAAHVSPFFSLAAVPVCSTAPFVLIKLQTWLHSHHRCAFLSWLMQFLPPTISLLLRSPISTTAQYLISIKYWNFFLLQLTTVSLSNPEILREKREETELFGIFNKGSTG